MIIHRWKEIKTRTPPWILIKVNAMLFAKLYGMKIHQSILGSVCFFMGHDWIQDVFDPWEGPDYCRACGKIGKINDT